MRKSSSSLNFLVFVETLLVLVTPAYATLMIAASVQARNCEFMSHLSQLSYLEIFHLPFIRVVAMSIQSALWSSDKQCGTQCAAMSLMFKLDVSIVYAEPSLSPTSLAISSQVNFFVSF